MLWLLSKAYGAIVRLRNTLYDRGMLKSHDLGVWTISVGNITTGGTGKTPLVAHIAELLADRGERVCILTRGYGRKDENKRILVSDWTQIHADVTESGDEPLELATALLGKAIVVADANRAAAGEWVKSQFDVTCFILDDGFQHRRLARDVDIVCLDAAAPIAGGKLLPAGRLRELPATLARADLIVLTGIDVAGKEHDATMTASAAAPSARVFTAEKRIARLIPLIGDSTVNKGGADEGFFAFCGIGDPTSFFELLKKENIPIRGTHAYKDHHQYHHQELARLLNEAKLAGAKRLLTTSKDIVKLAGKDLGIPVWIAELKLRIEPDDLAQVISGRSRERSIADKVTCSR